MTRIYKIFDIQGDIISISDEYGESEVYASELKKVFVFVSKNNLITLCRQDYYTFPIPMEADYFSDEKMQELVDTIGVHIERDYRFTMIVKESHYFSGGSTSIKTKRNTIGRINIRMIFLINKKKVVPLQ